MRWRGQGLLLAATLISAGYFGWRWHLSQGVNQNIETIRMSGINIQPYVTAVRKFVADNQRLPDPNELILPQLSGDGLIKKVTLQAHGALQIEFTGATPDGNLLANMAPAFSPLTASEFRLEYVCISTRPKSLQRDICRSFPKGKLDEVEHENVEAFAKWKEIRQQDAQRNEAIANATLTETECDRIDRFINNQALQCVREKNSLVADRLAELSNSRFGNRPRLRPEVILQSPELLDQYNNECTQEWKQYKAQLVTSNEDFRSCVEEK